MKATDSKTVWARIGEIQRIAFIGRDVIAFGHGCHLKFINLLTDEKSVFSANNREAGDGIDCVTGHRQQNIFAYSEKRTFPSIFIRTYPSFEVISVFKDGPPNGYLDIVFSDASLLIALGDLPNFDLNVWNWIRGEKIAARRTDILSTTQSLRCSLGKPAFLAQLAVDSTELHLWDIFICGKKCILTEHVVQPPEDCEPFTALFWTTEGALLVLDKKGSVYSMTPNYQLEKIIDFSADGQMPPALTWYKQGMLVSGPNDEIRHYKKSGTWSMDWAVVPPVPLKKLICRLDHLVGVSHETDLLEYVPAQHEFRIVRKGGREFKSICLIYPVADYVATLCHNNLISLFQVTTGLLTFSFELTMRAIDMQSNPKFPYLVVGYDNGYVEFYSLYDPEKLVKMTQIHLCHDPINSLHFNDCGTVFLAANTQIGRFFIIEGLPGGEMEVIATVLADRQIIDYMMVTSQNCYRIFTIPATTPKYYAGNKITRYCFIKNKGTDIKSYVFKDETVMYQRIYGTTGSSRDRVFFAIPYGQKVIHELEVKRGEKVARLLRVLQTGHQMGQIYLRLKKEHALTWSFDGFLILRDAEFDRVIGMALPHHRMHGGIVTAYADPYGKYIISLGRDNVLTCTDISENEMNPELRQELESLLRSSNYKMLFSRRTLGFTPKPHMEGKTWLEIQDIIKTEHERRISRLAKESVKRDFKIIQKELQDLLTINIEGPDNEKLDLVEFNLDKKLYQENAEYQKKLRKATEIYLKKVIEEQNRISKYLLTEFLDVMENVGTVIKGIFADFQITNYVLRANSSVTNERLTICQKNRQLEKYMNNNRCFKAWVPKPAEEIVRVTTGKPSYPATDLQTTIIAEAIEEEEIEEVQQHKNLESKISFSGSDLEKFIELEHPHYLQNELETYFQAELQLLISKNDCYRLKQKFNKEFDNVMMQKAKDMNTLKDRNLQLRHTVSEINYFSVNKLFVRIEDPEWEQVEKPEQIRTVKDIEVPITPYISPSEQAILDAKAAEAERLRLLLLADDFRERALMAMMNGVLEIRWEDELRKDVPVPKCMIEKEPEHFNEDDLRAIREYEEKVKFLNSERERYKTLLHANYGKVSNISREIIKKFNSKLSDLLCFKLDLDKVFCQESSKIAKIKLFHFRKTVLVKKENEVLEKISHNDRVVNSVHQLMGTLHEEIAEVKSNVDNIQQKDKNLDKSFRRDFQDMSIVVQEQVAKLYKKRPKINIRGFSSSSALNELSKCILNPTYRPPSMSSESLEFLRALDQMDMYVGIPPIVDELTYQLLCRHRRMRIEYEAKLKAASVALADSEATVTAFQKRLVQKKEISVQLTQDLNQIRTDMVNMDKNIEIQIVIPRGLVELHTTGSLKDYEDAILICRKDIETINKVIQDVGKKKIKALHQAMAFHRRILLIEWQHKRYKMLIQDLEEKIFDIQNVRLTKEMQFFLKAKNKENSIPFETEVDMINASYQNTIQDRKDIVKRMKKQINVIRAQDKTLDEQIKDINMDVCELNLTKDHELDDREKSIIEARMTVLLKRDKLVKQIQQNHHEILVLQTELELLRLKTYPTLKYKIMN